MLGHCIYIRTKRTRICNSVTAPLAEIRPRGSSVRRAACFVLRTHACDRDATSQSSPTHLRVVRVGPCLGIG